MVGKTATILIMIAKGSWEIPPGTVLAGVPLLRRIVMVASRAGYRDILVMDDGSSGCGRLLEGTKAVLLPPARLADHLQSGRILVLASHLLPNSSLLTHLSEIPLRAETMAVPTSGIAAVETADPLNFQMFKLVLEKAEEPEIKLPTSAGSSEKQKSSRKNIYFCFIDYTKAFDCVDHNKLWTIL